MADYKIKIVTEADKAALTAVNKELGGVTEQTKKLDESQKKATDSTKSFAKENKGLLDGFKKLGNEVPILGAALNALKNPYTALAFAIGIVVVKIREFNEAVEASATKAQGLDRFNSVFRAFNTLAAERQSQRNALAEQLNDVGEKAKTAEERLRAVNDQIERTLRLEGNEDAANKAKELAGIDTSTAAGKLQAVAIENKYAARATDRETRRAAGIVTATGNARRMAQEKAFQLEGVLPGLESAEDAAAKKLSRAEAQQAALQSVGVMIGGKSIPIGEAMAERNRLQQEYDTGGGTMGYSGERGEQLRASLKSKIGTYAGGIEQYFQSIDLQGAVVRSARSEFDIASGRRSKAAAGLVAARESEATLGSTFTNQSAAFGQELASGRRVAGIEAGTRSLVAGNEIADMDAKENAKRQAEIAALLKEVVNSLGKTYTSSEDLLNAAKALESRLRSANAGGLQ